jgi:hypothetical protein
MSKRAQAVQDNQRDLEALASEVRAMTALLGDTARQLAAFGRAETATPVNEWICRVTPDELLDTWQALRGDKAEAHLLSRISRRRAARRAASL